MPSIDAVKTPYLILGGLFILVAVIFKFSSLPNKIELEPEVVAVSSLTAVEAGVNAEYYTSNILQMALGNFYKKERKFFFNAYIALEFGRRK